MPETIIVIPARLESTRLPGKALLDINGKPMLQRTWQAAMRSASDAVYVATDNPVIADTASQFGAQVLMSGQHNSGTDRIAEVIQQLSLNSDDIVINLQGDEPLMPATVLDGLADYAHQQSADACSVYSSLTEAERIADPNCVKVVCDHEGRALYFSRQPIPANAGSIGYRLHHGVYAYRVQLLKAWPGLIPGPLEQAEQLEQLRLLENGYSIAMLEAASPIPPGVDNAADLQRVCRIISG